MNELESRKLVSGPDETGLLEYAVLDSNGRRIGTEWLNASEIKAANRRLLRRLVEQSSMPRPNR